MYVWKKKNLGFIAHPKTASIATKRTLESLGATELGGHHEQLPEWCRPILESGGIIMSTVRNPFDLMVSWYFHYQRKLGGQVRSFKDWITLFFQNPNDYVRLGSFRGLQWTNRILRFENLQADFDAVLAEIGVEPTVIEQWNVSHLREGRPYREFYDDETRELVASQFWQELADLDYCF